MDCLLILVDGSGAGFRELCLCLLRRLLWLCLLCSFIAIKICYLSYIWELTIRALLATDGINHGQIDIFQTI